MAGSNDTKRSIRVFIASPGGLEIARRAFKDKIDELNKGFGDGRGVEFVPLGWEDTLSPAGQRVQSEINKDVESCDLFLLVLDKVWGRRNKDAVWHPVACLPGLAKLRASNTMEEFSLAMSRWEKLQRPAVHVALKKLPVDANRDPGPELKCVLKFRRILAESGKVLYKEWENTDQFSSIVDAVLRAHARPDDNDPGDTIDHAPEPPDFGPEFRQRLTELEAELMLARKESLRAQKEVAELRSRLPAQTSKKRKGKESRAATQAKFSAARAQSARAEALALGLAESAARAALEGKIEQARQDFAAAIEGTTNLRVLFLGYQFFFRIGELDEAERLMRCWLAISGPDAQTAATAAAYGNLGLIHKTRGELDEAERMHRKSLGIEEKLGRLEGMASDYGNLGLIHRQRGDLDEAERMLRKSLAIHEKLSHLGGLANDYGNLGLIRWSRGELDEAERMHRKALEIDEKIGRLKGMATEYGNLGLIHRERGELEEAERMHREALEIHEKLGRLEGMANNYAAIGLVHVGRGEPDEAERMHRAALQIEEKLGRLEGMARQYANLGGVSNNRGDGREARGFWTKSRDLYARIGMPHMVAEVQGLLDGMDDPPAA